MKKNELSDENKRKLTLYMKYNEFINEFAHKGIAYTDPKNDYKLLGKLLNLLELTNMDKLPIITAIRDHYKVLKNRKDLKDEIAELQKMIKWEINETIDFIVRRKDKYFENPARLYLSYNSNKNQFEILTNLGLSLEDEANENLTYLIDSTYWKMVFYIAPILPADRFSICPRCGGLVFAASNIKKIYCGRKCTKSVIQEKYRENKVIEH
jgi:hypothetical protein